MNSRALLIGLDGATFSILDPLIEDGVMPFLRGFMASGARAVLRSILPPLTPPAWTSIMTGRSPGNHGVADFFAFESPQSRYVRLANSSDVRCETVWSIVSRHGLSATTLNFPVMAPPRPITGCAIPGWVPWRFLRRSCHPADLYDRIKDLPAFNVKELAMNLDLEQKALDGCPPEDQEAWVRFHLRRERQWFEILAFLIRSEPHHLTAIVFDGVDKLQHLFWRLLDPACAPARLSPGEERLRGLCRDYFRQLDGLMAQAVALAGDDVNVFVVSDHGFGPSHEIFYVNSWLHRHGYLNWANDDRGYRDDSDTLGLQMIGWLDRLIDWGGTTAYAQTPSSNGIHICVAGRRGKEGIPPGEYHRFRQTLMDELRAYCDPKTGDSPVTGVWTREEAFPGGHADSAPDLTLQLRDGGFVSTVKSECLLTPRKEPLGTHRPEGIFLAHGPAVARGSSLPECSVLDVTPTLLHALGLPVPEDLEGRVLGEIFEPQFLQAHRIAMGEPTHPPEVFPSPAMDREGAEQVIARLKALGYVE